MDLNEFAERDFRRIHRQGLTTSMIQTTSSMKAKNLDTTTMQGFIAMKPGPKHNTAILRLTFIGRSIHSPTHAAHRKLSRRAFP